MQYFEQNKGRALNYQGADEAELEKALQESMKTWEAEEGGRGGDDSGGMVGQVLNAGKAGVTKEEPTF